VYTFGRNAAGTGVGQRCLAVWLASVLEFRVPDSRFRVLVLVFRDPCSGFLGGMRDFI